MFKNMEVFLIGRFMGLILAHKIPLEVMTEFK